MKMPTLFSYTAGVAGVAIALAGCSSGSSSSGLPSAPVAGETSPGSALAGGGIDPTSQLRPMPSAQDVAYARAHFHPHLIWASPDKAPRRPRLLFMGDGDVGEVFIYTMPQLKLLAKVGGFVEPQGECTDKSGNIWVTDYAVNRITKLSRSGQVLTTLDQTLASAPSGCSVDPKTGDLAVANSYGPDFPFKGKIVIYAGGSGHATAISNPDVVYWQDTAYDSSGHLWADGLNGTYNFNLSSCDASSCSTKSLSGGTIYFPGFVQWVGKQNSWYVADAFCGNLRKVCIYPVSGSGHVGTPITLKDSHDNDICEMFEGAITNAVSKVLVGGARACNGGVGVHRWSFPDGGAPTHSHEGDGLGDPTGAAISAR